MPWVCETCEMRFESKGPQRERHVATCPSGHPQVEVQTAVRGFTWGAGWALFALFVGGLWMWILRWPLFDLDLTWAVAPVALVTLAVVAIEAIRSQFKARRYLSSSSPVSDLAARQQGFSNGVWAVLALVVTIGIARVFVNVG